MTLALRDINAEAATGEEVITAPRPCTDEELDALYAAADLPELGRAFVQEIREAIVAARRVNISHKNGEYASIVTGLSNQFESDQELNVVALCDLRFVDWKSQAAGIRVRGRTERGLERRRLWPDIHGAELCRDASGRRLLKFVAEDWAPEADWETEMAKFPGWFVRRPDGSLGSPPLEAFYAERGIEYRVRSYERDLDGLEARNAMVASRYYLKPYTVRRRIADRALEVAKAAPRLLLPDWEAAVPGMTRTEAMCLVAWRYVKAPLKTFDLAQPQTVPIFGSDDDLELFLESRPALKDLSVLSLTRGAKLDFKGRRWEVFGVERGLIELHCEATGELKPFREEDLREQSRLGEIRPVASAPSIPVAWVNASEKKKQRARAERTRLQRLLEGGKPMRRSDREKAARYLAAAHTFANGLVALLDRRGGQRGRSKLSLEQEALVEEAVNLWRKTPEHRSFELAYSTYERACNNHTPAPVPPVSRRTFQLRVEAKGRARVLRERDGWRAAATIDPPALLTEIEHELAEAPHAMYRCQFDHSPSNVNVVDSYYEGLELGVPWMTKVIDEYALCRLYTVLLFDPPSYRSDMLAWRGMVEIVGASATFGYTDNGSDFWSNNWADLLTDFGTHLKRRGAGRARQGASIEGAFGSQQRSLLHNLAGNTQMGAVQSSGARHTFATLLRAIEEDDKRFNETPHPVFQKPRIQVFNESLAAMGIRRDLIADRRTFLILTSPPADDPIVHVSRQGIKSGRLHYWHPKFREMLGQPVEVRVSPFDISVRYAYGQGEWLDAVSAKHARLFRGKSEREVAIFSQEMTARMRRNHFGLDLARVIAGAEADAAAAADFRRSREQEDALRAQGHLPEAVRSDDATQLVSPTTRRTRRLASRNIGEVA